MPYANAGGVRLYYEEAGKGTPIVFVHEFADDLHSWEPQIRFFSRRYRCIAYNARGYPPSDVPKARSMYSQAIATDDIAHVMRHLEACARRTSSAARWAATRPCISDCATRGSRSRLRRSASATARIPTSASSS